MRYWIIINVVFNILLCLFCPAIFMWCHITICIIALFAFHVNRNAANYDKRNEHEKVETQTEIEEKPKKAEWFSFLILD